MESNRNSGFACIGIVGLGLIGGSFAKTIRQKTNCRILGCDLDAALVQRACQEKVLDEALTAETCAACDMLLVALYPQATIAWMQQHAPSIPAHCVVIDCCGVKRAVSPVLCDLAAQYGFRYVGGHPMAGREQSGYNAATASLFEGASMILTDVPEDLDAQLEAFFVSLGFGGICRSTPSQHDRIIAYTSQLAHVLSSAYVKSPAALEHDGFSAGSFADMTRVAYLNETMWTQLFLDNADYLSEEVRGLCSRLCEYADALEHRDEKTLFTLLQQGRLRKTYLTQRSARKE